MAAYPIRLDVTARRIVIVGGGGVARRKANGLLDAGATDVTVVSPTLADGFPAVRHVAALYDAAHLAGAQLVFAATDNPAVNTRVVIDARAVGAWVCRADAVGAESGGDAAGHRAVTIEALHADATPTPHALATGAPADDAADDAAHGDFQTPAVFRDGPIVVTVSTGSAALTAAVRDGLRDRFDPRWAAMAGAMTELRPLLIARLPAGERAGAFRKLAGEAALDVLERDGVNGLKAWLGVDGGDR